MHRTLQFMKYRLLGKHWNDGWLAKWVIYFLLSIIAFLYLSPVLYMISTMLMNLDDLLDPSVQWIPSAFRIANLRTAWLGLDYPKAFMYTGIIALSGATIQVFACAVVGYALARLRFPGRSLFFGLIVVSFLIPPQVLIIPKYMLFSELGWLNTPWVFLVPALFGQGLKSALFILIFRQFFISLPQSLEEAAAIDGASRLRMFIGIMLPLAKPAILVVFLFAFVWYWNQFYEPSMFLNEKFTPLSIRLSRLENALVQVAPIERLSESVKMAGAFLIILPPLLIYMFTQRWFVEGVERTGTVE